MSAGLERPLSFGDVFTDHLVLQRGAPIPVWGFGPPGEAVEVTFADQAAQTRVGRDGRWRVDLAPLEASVQGRPLRARTPTRAVTCRDVLVGDVWLCSGQSNMELGVGSADHRREALAGAALPLVRLFLIHKSSAPVPLDHFPAAAGGPRWRVCTPRAVLAGGWGGFSAVAFAFGRRLVAELGVPVGLIQAAYGGSRIAPFLPLTRLRGHPALTADAAEVRAANAEWSRRVRETGPLDAPARLALHPFAPLDAWNALKPGTVWNAMLQPLLPFALCGALWYQGESDVGDADPYPARLRALMGALRRAFARPDLPVYAAQLAPYRYGRDEDLLNLWAAQQAGTRGANTGLVGTADLGDLNDIHPRRKVPVGERLASLALHCTYARPDCPPGGPQVRSVRFHPGGATLSFRTHAGSPLDTTDGASARGFALAGADGMFHPALAHLRGARAQLTCAEVPDPRRVRHAWQVGAEPNLTDAGRLPALPFLLPVPAGS